MVIAASTIPEASSDHIGVLRVMVAAALTTGIVFLLCWLGTLIPSASPAHSFIGLFTKAPAASSQALGEGLGWSPLFGGLVGGVFAVIYNLLPSRR